MLIKRASVLIALTLLVGCASETADVDPNTEEDTDAEQADVAPPTGTVVQKQEVITSPRDTASGQATGKRAHGPIRARGYYDQ